MYNGSLGMSRAVALFLLVPALFAQNAADLFQKAPPEVDQALRDRIAKFFQAHVDGKFREAEQYVAEDSKDIYYGASKPRYLSFEILRLDYSENFTRAKATVLCEQRIMFPGFDGKAVKIPMGSTWKLENGQWYWWIDQSKAIDTPFGKMKRSTSSDQGAPPPPQVMPDIHAIQSQVKLDKKTVELTGENPESVKVLNGADGQVSLSLEAPALPGFEAKLDKTELHAGETATLTLKITHKPEAVRSLIVAVRVQPLNTLLPVQVNLR
jgi:hypothetical protein